MGNYQFKEYYLDVGPESHNSDSDSEENQEDSNEEEILVERTERNVTPTPVRATRRPRRILFRDRTPESEYQSKEEIDRPVGINALNQNLEALHLGTPCQRRPITYMYINQVHTLRRTEINLMESRVTLEESM